ncbi:MAG: hypothetical protein WCJ29_00030 [bacterium]
MEPGLSGSGPSDLKVVKGTPIDTTNEKYEISANMDKLAPELFVNQVQGYLKGYSDRQGLSVAAELKAVQRALVQEVAKMNASNWSGMKTAGEKNRHLLEVAKKAYFSGGQKAKKTGTQ